MLLSPLLITTSFFFCFCFYHRIKSGRSLTWQSELIVFNTKYLFMYTNSDIISLSDLHSSYDEYDNDGGDASFPEPEPQEREKRKGAEPFCLRERKKRSKLIFHSSFLSANLPKTLLDFAYYYHSHPSRHYHVILLLPSLPQTLLYLLSHFSYPS